MSDRYYKLDESGVNPVACDLESWAGFLQDISKRVVKRETIGDSDVSTVFLGMDHSVLQYSSLKSAHKPVLWETMVFGGKLDQEQDRCSGTRHDAEKMHARMVARVKQSISK